MKSVLSGVIAIVALIVVAVIFIFSGAYNVAASTEHSGIVRWALSTTMDRSVEARARSITTPALSDQAMITDGFKHYGEMCETCHGAPGIEPSEIGQGLNPQAPDLQESATDLSAAEIYWIVKNGIRMSGMPAFGVTHDERQLWSIVAFVEQLPKIDQESYKRMKADIRDER